MTEQALARRGRWFYELGRARWAFRTVALVLALLVVARLIGRPTPLVLGLGTVLATVGFTAAMLHHRWARAFRVGVLAGLPAFLLPLIIRTLDLLPRGAAIDPCVPASFLSGVAAGWFVSRRALDEEHRLPFWALAVVTTALVGTLGCSVAGGGGVLGVVAGVLAGSAPVVLRAGLQRS
jgi:hypothetical protein